MNATIYVRVSTTEQAEFGYSLASQEQICRDFALRNKYEVSKVFIERGESAKTTNRTELNNMLRYIKANKDKVDALIIYKLDRLSRDMLDSLNIRITLDKLNITLKSVTEPFDNSPVGTFTASMFSLIAQFDNDTRTERVKLGMRQAMMDGRWLWNAPFGYTTIIIDHKSYLKPTGDAITVKKIFNDFVNCKKQYEICNDLAKYGIKITKQHLNGILKNYLYIGKLKSKCIDEIIDGVHEPIIDEITFYKAQGMLNPKANKTYCLKYEDEFPLKRFLKCPNCNKNLTGSYSIARNKTRHPYYHCVKKGCGFKPIRRDYADYLFFEYLKSFEMRQDVTNKIFDDAKVFLEDKQGEDKNIVANIKRDITTLEAKKKKIEDLAINGTFDKETYHERINETKEEIISKQILLNDHESKVLNIDELIDFGKRFVFNLSGLWLNLDTSKKRNFQEMFFPEGIYLENSEFRTTQISPILRLIQQQNNLRNNGQSILAGERGFEPFICSFCFLSFYKPPSKLLLKSDESPLFTKLTI
ncbi:MAG: recombinase family protein [Candidatus Humimicrobiaceae bacterium]